jgi:hypothetical protein
MMNIYSLKNSALLFSGFLAFFAIGCGGGGGSSDTVEDDSIWETTEVVDTIENDESSENESPEETEAPESDTEEPAPEDPLANEEDLAVLLDEFKLYTNKNKLTANNITLDGFEWRENSLQSTTSHARIPALQFYVLGANRQLLYKTEVADFDEIGEQVELRFKSEIAPMCLIFKVGEDKVVIQLNSSEPSLKESSRESAFESYVTFYIQKVQYEAPKEEKPEITMPKVDDLVVTEFPEIDVDLEGIRVEDYRGEDVIKEDRPYLDVELRELTMDKGLTDLEVEAPAESYLY